MTNIDLMSICFTFVQWVYKCLYMCTYTVDDFIILNSFLVLLNDVRQTCFTIQTLTDTILENTETVTIIIDAMPGITPGNVIISQTNATLIISK